MKKYWQDIKELHDKNPKIKKTPAEEEKISIVDLLDKKTRSSRRDFLKAFGFSIASTAVVASCKRPVTKAIPHLIKPETTVPGKAEYYASTFYDGKQYASILVKVRDGRPIKIEGNNLSSLTKGSSSPIVQASVLELYDENRIRQPMINLQPTKWEEIDKEITRKLQNIKTKQGKTVLLTSSIISPSTLEVIERFRNQYPGFRHITYDPVSVSGILEANEKTFGKRALPSLDFAKAKTIVSIGADFLGNWLSPIEFAKDYALGKKLDYGQKSLSKHYQIETGMSLTGSNADVRIPIKPSEEKITIANLYKELLLLDGQQLGFELPETEIDLITIASELHQNKQKSLVVCGSNDPETQILINAINQLLNNYGNTISLNSPLNTKNGIDSEMANLVAEMNAGQIAGLLFYNVNPVYDYPKADEFKAGLDKVGLTVSFSGFIDETSALAEYICPDNHYLESWNDANPQKGFYSLCQPAINPLHNTRQMQQSLLLWAGGKTGYRNFIKQHWEKNLFHQNNNYLSFTDFWNHSLQDGVFEPEQTNLVEQPNFNNPGLEKTLSGIQANKTDEIEVHLYENNTIGSGKHTNNPWLHETPDAITKVCWDNYAAISPKFANDRLLETGDVIRINGETEIPVLVQPGQKYGTFSIAMGYGRTMGGKVADNLGTNAYPLVLANENGNRIYSQTVQFEKTGKKHEFATTQSHNSMEGRPIIRETTLGEYLENPASGNELHKETQKHLHSLYEKIEFEGHHWGMVVDLNTCIGCNACVVACSSENNVPVVGKEEIKRVHEMHWIRIDRYYSSDSENPEVLRQPVMCQHCDNAPCENVCPVAATTHSSEGINQMAYNRCIGTRYCNNNCPYKVRRFNWSDYTKADAIPKNTVDVAGLTNDLPRMVLNPDVTVRAKGVMEKCSFCVQRIQDKKLQAKTENRSLRDGEIKTACEQACPSHAIVFGDLNDKKSRVSKLMKNPRNYHVLEQLHTLPSVGYLTKVKNV